MIFKDDILIKKEHLFYEKVKNDNESINDYVNLQKKLLHDILIKIIDVSMLIKCKIFQHKFLKLQKFENEDSINVASYVRSQLAESIRRNPYQANVLIAGYDNDGPKLYWLDYLGSIVRVAKAAHGYGAYFLYGLMDNYYKKGFNYNDGVDVIKKCIKELKTRFLVNMCEFDVFKITKDGIEDVSEQFKEKN